jgi:hypothetical protein
MVRLPEPEIKADPEKAAAARAKIKEMLSQVVRPVPKEKGDVGANTR